MGSESVASVKLRPMAPDDIKHMLGWPRYEGKTDQWANLPAESPEEGEEWLRTYHQPPKCYCLAVVSDTGELAGRCNLAVLDEETRVGGIFSFTIRRDMSERGFAQAALAELLRFSFGELDMPAIYLYTQAANRKARHIYDKLGFKYMGSHDDYRDGQGYVKFVDLVAWRRDWEQGSQDK